MIGENSPRPQPEDHPYWEQWIARQDACPDEILEEMPPNHLSYVQETVLTRDVRCMALATYFGMLPNPYFAPFPPCVRGEGCAIMEYELQQIVRADGQE